MKQKTVELNLTNKPSIILMSGLPGSGKTTLTETCPFLKIKK